MDHTNIQLYNIQLHNVQWTYPYPENIPHLMGKIEGFIHGYMASLSPYDDIEYLENLKFVAKIILDKYLKQQDEFIIW